MDHDFWHQRWQSGEIGFHEGQANAMLVSYFDELALPDGARVFVPLCGKTRDIAWLMSRNMKVAGAELSKQAVEALFEDLGIVPDITEHGAIRRYSGPGIDIYVGDIFDLDAITLGPVDAVFDRAALVALPEEMRIRYAKHLIALTGGARQLLVTFEYDQSVMPGPPFSISMDQVQQRYADDYEIRNCHSTEVAGGLKGKCPARETVWLLAPRA
ncbi:MAG: thiopurine S-methyltransferase [Pseudomonadota bacterium]